MRRAFILLAVLGVMLAGAPRAAAGDFGQWIKGLERDYNLRRTRIPFFWLAKAVVRVASPAGVSRLDLAIFEDQDVSRMLQAGDLQGRVHHLLGAGWKPFIEVQAPREGERVLLYARERGRDMELFLLSVERNEAVALLCKVNPEALSRTIEEPKFLLSGAVQ